jgi:hypothetical protein
LEGGYGPVSITRFGFGLGDSGLRSGAMVQGVKMRNRELNDWDCEGRKAVRRRRNASLTTRYCIAVIVCAFAPARQRHEAAARRTYYFKFLCGLLKGGCALGRFANLERISEQA